MFDLSEKCRCRQAGRQIDRQIDRQTALCSWSGCPSVESASPGRGGSPLPGLVGPAAAGLRWFGQLQGKKKKNPCKKQPASPAELVHTVKEGDICREREREQGPSSLPASDPETCSGLQADATDPALRQHPSADTTVSAPLWLLQTPAPLLPCPGGRDQVAALSWWGAPTLQGPPWVCWVRGSPGCVAATSWDTSSSHSLSVTHVRWIWFSCRVYVCITQGSEHPQHQCVTYRGRGNNTLQL